MFNIKAIGPNVKDISKLSFPEGGCLIGVDLLRTLLNQMILRATF